MDLRGSIWQLVRAALEEDVGPGDITSLACLDPELVRAAIVAKADGVLSGTEPAEAVFKTVDPAIDVRLKLHDGNRFQAGQTVMELEGFNQPLLVAERTALNFLAHLSGVATLTARFVEKIANTSCRILDTRKTTPGWRLLEKQAVRHGGGSNHRLGLYDMVLIKDNHIAAAGSVARAVARAQEYVLSDDFRRQFQTDSATIGIEVEVSDRSDLEQAIAAGASRLLLDNQSVESLRILATRARELNPDVQLEASGNVTLENVAKIAATGVDFVSIGALTHSAPASDFSMGIITT